MRKTKPPIIKARHEGSVNPYPPARPPRHRRFVRKSDAHGVEFQVDRASKPSRPWLTSGLLLAATAAGMALSIKNHYLLGLLLAPTLGVPALHGLWRGGMRKMIMLPVSLVVLYLAAGHPQFADPIIRSFFGTSSNLANVGVTVSFVIFTLLFVGHFVKVLRNRTIGHRPVMLAADRFGGAGLGLLEGAVFFLMICWLAVLVAPQARVVRDHPNIPAGSFQQRTAACLVQLAEEINHSPIEPIANDANLLEQIPAMRDLIYDVGDLQQRQLESSSPLTKRQALENLRKAHPQLFQTLIQQLEKNNPAREPSSRQ